MAIPVIFSGLLTLPNLTLTLIDQNDWERIVKKLLKILGILFKVIGIFVVLAFIAFWSIRITIWNSNIKAYHTIDLDDGPHVFWLNDSTINVASFKYIPAENPFALSKVLDAAQNMKITVNYKVIEKIIDLRDTTDVLKRMDADFGIEFNPYEKPDIDESEYHAGKIAALSDIHGCYDHFITMLKNNLIIDQETNWSWGNGHLVLAGDVVDKGPWQTNCLWLIRKLEKQAERAGGKVHYLLGNHETALLRESAGRSDKIRTPGHKYPAIGKAIGIPYAHLFSEKSELGRWLRTKNTMVKINDNLFLHAGISNQLLEKDLTIDELNRYGRNYVDYDHWLAADSKDREIYKLFEDYWGPYEYKGYFDDKVYKEDFSEKTVDDALSFYNCKRIIVGHSSIRNIHLRHNSKVVAIGIKLPRDGKILDDENAQMLVIKDNKLQILNIRGKQEFLTE